ncbi:ABC transporter permease [Paenibacillus sp. CGMCC 1.16610]|uniref:Transport permease protein n=1 Tax=Paenibacillus anseongense TaxID=2682845 RepID=A0ABW9U2H5_9BACL|nr:MULTISPECIES: ABC transporter permease [Paenibacillus]MBA2943248.1 ABC transporter permease [Paenibacillus sp. CGMCC 1.16610]MVQ33746.1 ABC transporter permease [Paenibacillus anseongense]
MQQKKYKFDIFSIFSTLWAHYELIKQFTKREIASRYKGSLLGIVWSLITPIIMLFIYTFVFSEIFKSRWTVDNDNKLQFALIVYCGLIIFNIFAEVTTRAPSLILNNPNYVKKVIFPLEILPVVSMLSALFQGSISYIILIIGILINQGTISISLILLPILIIPFLLFLVGITWILAAFGVYFRDIGQIIGLAIQGIMLLTPIFYPISVVPDKYLMIYHLNPLVYIVEDTRKVLIWGQFPSWYSLSLSFLIGFVFFVIGYNFFKRTKGGFSDVI